MRSMLLLVALSVATTACKRGDDRDGDGVPDASDCAPDDAGYSAEQTFLGDGDGDGFGIDTTSCLPPEREADQPGDCNDGDAGVYPGAEERCDDRDEDCDGIVDEDAVDVPSWSKDADDDGFGSIIGIVEECAAPFGYVSEGGDCNDVDDTIRPDADEVCDGVDQDCDGAVDEDPIGGPRWYLDADEDGYGIEGDALDACVQPEGYAAASGDCDDADAWVNPAAVEYCNGLDDDCDGLLDKDDPDEAGDATWYLDGDGDGWGTPGSGTTSCSPPSGYARFDTDCDDTNDAVHPDAVEVCENGLDDDCDGLARDCGEGGETELNADGYASWLGEFESGSLGIGRAVTAVGDWNGDGRPELALGAQGVSGATGAVYFADGGSVGTRSVRGLVTLSGAAAADYAGAAVAPMGDTDGDGVDDVLIGSPGADENTGAAYLVRGPVIASGLLSDAAAATLTGPAASQAGFSVASAGDHDGDGVADLLVGANLAEAGAGRVYLASGASTGSVDLESGSLGVVTGGAHEGLGWSVSAGDLTGDGLFDVAVGGPYDGDSSGRAWLIEGPLAGEVAAADAIVVSSEQTGSVTTAAIELRGDYNGDGYADLVVGAPNWDSTTELDPGRAYVVFGPVVADVDLADADAFFNGQLNGVCGRTVSWAGSPDGDLVDDLVIGCPNAWDITAPGLAVLVYGGFEPGQYRLASTGRRWKGVADFDFVGAGVGPAGDQDGDGVDDLLVAAPYESTSAAYAGRVTVVLGSAAF